MRLREALEINAQIKQNYYQQIEDILQYVTRFFTVSEMTFVIGRLPADMPYLHHFRLCFENGAVIDERWLVLTSDFENYYGRNS